MRGVRVQSLPPQPSPGYEPFQVDVHPERTVVRVAPAGELDLATADTLAAELRELRDAGFDHVVLDMRRLTFIDSTGIALLLSEDRRARKDGHDFVLISGTPAIQRVLEICGVAGLLRYRSSHTQESTPEPGEHEAIVGL